MLLFLNAVESPFTAPLYLHTPPPSMLTDYFSEKIKRIVSPSGAGNSKTCIMKYRKIVANGMSRKIGRFFFNPKKRLKPVMPSITYKIICKGQLL